MAVPDPAIWPPLVGSRVVVRVRAGGGRTRDVLGDLLAADLSAEGGRLRIATRRGTEEVDVADVLAGKPVPPPPVRSAPPHRALSALGLERAMAGHWRAVETAELGGWLLRASAGFTNRANSVLPLGAPDRAPGEAVEAAVAWYAGRGLDPRAAAPVPAAGDPDADVLVTAATAFAAAGFRPIEGAGALVLTAPTAELRGPLEPPAGLRVELLDAPDDGWLARYHYRGQAVPPVGRELLLSAPRQVFAAVRDGAGDGGETVAVARGSLANGWAGLTAVEVGPEHRRLGLARLLLRAVAGWAWREGAVATYVQVGETNDAARALYLSAGFTPHHIYAYLSRP